MGHFTPKPIINNSITKFVSNFVNVKLEKIKKFKHLTRRLTMYTLPAMFFFAKYDLDYRDICIICKIIDTKEHKNE